MHILASSKMISHGASAEWSWMEIKSSKANSWMVRPMAGVATLISTVSVLKATLKRVFSAALSFKKN